MSTESLWQRRPHTKGGPRGDGSTVHLVQRTGRKETPCEGFDEQTELEQLTETITKDYLTAPVKSSARVQARLRVTRHLKRLLRCTGDSDKGELAVREFMTSSQEEQDKAIADSYTPLGGYAAAVPFWAGPAKTSLLGLGARVRELKLHDVPGDVWGPGHEYDGREHSTESTKTAVANEPILEEVHILGCLGHHFTSHLAPGFFTDSSILRGFDLRYSLHRHPQGFPKVALVAISGCSSLCTLAQRVLRPCFPSAQFLGAQNTMTKFAGRTIWPTFRKRLLEDATPLLLDNDVDHTFISDAWMNACTVAMRKEGIRLLNEKGVKVSAFRIKAKQIQLIRKIGIGFAHGDRAHLLVDEKGRHEPTALASPANACEAKFDERHILVPPKGFTLPPL